ncbi:unchacterized apicomplexan-specific serine rich low complexity protein [Cryptosporidium felis]|nr:unchacterized apicomplexan-specific serine rich low complexity protein [Cryptosporidium felis]
MVDNAIELNLSISGRKRRLSTDDDDVSGTQESNMELTVQTREYSSKESTPRIIMNKSARSRRVLNSDSSSEGGNSGEEGEKLMGNSQSQQSDSQSSEFSSEPSEEEDSDSDSFSDSSSSTKKIKLIKSESGTPLRSGTKKTNSKRASIKQPKANKSSIKTKAKSTSKTNNTKQKTSTQKKQTIKEKTQSSQDESSDEGESTAYVPRRDRDHKQILVAAILCRWWHALPDWPPPDTDYPALLKEKKLRLVDIEDWEEAPEIDEEGFSKVYELSEYKGVFRDSKGAAHDLRPVENKPCYSNLIKMDETKLYELLILALENQIKTLETNSPGDSKLIDELKRELLEAQALLTRKTAKKK